MFSSRRKIFVLCVAALMLLIISIKPGYKVQQHDDTATLAQNLLHQAELSHNNFQARPRAERTEQDYLGIITLYRQSVDADIEHHYSDTAFLAMAQLAEEMALQLQKTRYHYNAIDYYQQMVTNYPQSPNCALALFNRARILEQSLDNRSEAIQVYSQLIKFFPKSVSAREASANLARLLHLEHNEDNSAETIESGGEEKTITSVRNFTGPDFARVVLDIDAPVHYEKNDIGNGNFALVFSQAKLAEKFIGKIPITDDSGLLKSISTETSSSSVKLHVVCNRLRDYAIFSLNNPYRLIIDLHGVNSVNNNGNSNGNSNTLAQPAQEDAARLEARKEELLEPKPNAISFTRVLGLKVRRIVIDAGHGGHDTGAIGDGLLEKDLVLDVALKLRALIKQRMPDIDVVMTRDGDRFVALEERTAIANAQAADLFISVHANSSANSEASGVETYYLSINASKEELDVAARENASTARNARDLQTLLQKIVLDDKVIESRDFAQQLQRSMVNGLSKIDASAGVNRGIKKAPFIVLIGANMPSVLAEISFVSNTQQIKLLKTPEFRQKIAESLCEGTKKYIDALSKGLPSTAANR